MKQEDKRSLVKPDQDGKPIPGEKKKKKKSLISINDRQFSMALDSPWWQCRGCFHDPDRSSEIHLPDGSLFLSQQREEENVAPQASRQKVLAGTREAGRYSSKSAPALQGERITHRSRRAVRFRRVQTDMTPARGFEARESACARGASENRDSAHRRRARRPRAGGNLISPRRKD